MFSTVFFQAPVLGVVAGNKRVLAILASYYSHKRKGFVVEHLASLEVIKVDSLSLFDELDALFMKHSIPRTNLVSILMDSCNVMRGRMSFVETRIRSGRAPQLLDVDGDTCHHMHNACKQFAANRFTIGPNICSLTSTTMSSGLGSIWKSSAPS